MKYLISLSAITLLLLYGCNKKENIPAPYITAFADDFPFFASSAQVSTFKSDGGTYTSLEVTGVMGSGATMKLWIRNYSGALDTLSMDSTGASATFLPVTPSVEVKSSYGQLIITSSTPTLKGEFDFTCNDSTKVKGSFQVIP